MISKEDSLKIGLEINRIASVLDDDSLAKVKESLYTIEDTLVKHCKEDEEIRKANNKDELVGMLLPHLRKALKILKDNDIHQLVSAAFNSDTDYIAFYCSDTDNEKINNFDYCEFDGCKKGE